MNAEWDIWRGAFSPSHVLHQVSTSQTNERRRYISFNYFLEGEFGDKTNYATF